MKTTPILLSAIIALGALNACSEKKKETTSQKMVEEITEVDVIIPPGRQLAELSFDSLDSEGRGYLDKEQVDEFADLVHVSMDGDEDGNVDSKEFLSWGFGFQNIADDKDRVAEYENALLSVYNQWDTNADGKLTLDEQMAAMDKDFATADADGDGKLTRAEYFSDFPIIVAVKSVLKPE